MKTVYLDRTVDDGKQTLGVLTIEDEDGKILFSCKTLELPWKNNQHQISCIPCDSYKIIWSKSERLSKVAGHDVFTYEVLMVADRSGIRIHSANYVQQLLGCVALGSAYADINGDGTKDLINSKLTLNKFHETLNEEDSEIIITNTF